jgi:hypothetical protein
VRHGFSAFVFSFSFSNGASFLWMPTICQDRLGTNTRKTHQKMGGDHTQSEKIVQRALDQLMAQVVQNHPHSQFPF